MNHIEFLLLLLNCIALFLLLRNRQNSVQTNDFLKVDHFYRELSIVKKSIVEIPRKTMNTFQGSTNVNKGAFAEWAAYHKLCKQYDKVVFFNTIFDFLCIRFPREGDLGSLDFIDVKSGKASLSKDQRAMRDLIKEGRIDFKTVRIKVD